MSLRQIDALFVSVDRDDHGNPKFPAPGGRMPTAREAHAYRCFLCGVRDKDTVEATWREERERREGRRRKGAGRGAAKKGRKAGGG